MLRDGGDPDEIVRFLNADLDALAATPGADPRAVQRVREKLLARFGAQAHRNARRKRILMAIPVALLALVAITYFTLKFVNSVSIDQPAATREGMIQRAKAVRKILYYESWKLNEIPHPRARNFFELLLWPYEPTESEIEGVIELAGEIRQASANQVGQAPWGPVNCGIAFDGNSLGMKMALGHISARLRDPATQWTGTPQQTLRRIVHDYSCPDYSRLEASGK